MSLKFNLFITFLAVVTSISSCGYKLAGSGEFASSLDNTSVQGAVPSRELTRYIEKHLISNDINVVDANQASAIITILNEETDRTVISLDDEGKVREFELILNIEYEVKSAGGSTLMSSKKININRDFVFNKTNILGSEQEQQNMYSEMRDDAARVIVYRLQQISD